MARRAGVARSRVAAGRRGRMRRMCRMRRLRGVSRVRRKGGRRRLAVLLAGLAPLVGVGARVLVGPGDVYAEGAKHRLRGGLGSAGKRAGRGSSDAAAERHNRGRDRNDGQLPAAASSEGGDTRQQLAVGGESFELTRLGPRVRGSGGRQEGLQPGELDRTGGLRGRGRLDQPVELCVSIGRLRSLCHARRSLAAAGALQLAVKVTRPSRRGAWPAA